MASSFRIWIRASENGEVAQQVRRRIHNRRSGFKSPSCFRKSAQYCADFLFQQCGAEVCKNTLIFNFVEITCKPNHILIIFAGNSAVYGNLTLTNGLEIQRCTVATRSLEKVRKAFPNTSIQGLSNSFTGKP